MPLGFIAGSNLVFYFFLKKFEKFFRPKIGIFLVCIKKLFLSFFLKLPGKLVPVVKAKKIVFLVLLSKKNIKVVSGSKYGAFRYTFS
jgi:hypothetical protein